MCQSEPSIHPGGAHVAQWAGRGEAGAQKWNQIMECLEAGLGGPEGTGKPLKER